MGVTRSFFFSIDVHIGVTSKSVNRQHGLFFLELCRMLTVCSNAFITDVFDVAARPAADCRHGCCDAFLSSGSNCGGTAAAAGPQPQDITIPGIFRNVRTANVVAISALTAGDHFLHSVPGTVAKAVQLALRHYCSVASSDVFVLMSLSSCIIMLLTWCAMVSAS